MKTLKKIAGQAVTAAIWVWKVPFVRSVIATRLIQLGTVGCIIVAVADAVAK